MSSGRECQCGQSHAACNNEFQYAVKVVCGRVAPSPAGSVTPVAPGQYWTAVNIHNPSKCEGARFRWKVSVGRPGSPGPVSAYQNARVLGPDRALEIDCRQILNSFPPPAPGFVKGYVVIESNVELDVVAVYSTAPSATATVNSFHTERVQPRCVPVCEDLVLPLDTGVAAWQTVAAPSGPLGPVVPLTNLPSAWGAAPFGSSWVSQVAADSQSGTAGIRHYDLCFDLCFGFTVPARFNIQGLADNRATVLLNGNTVGNIPGFGAPPTTLTVNPQFLSPGRNCFRVSVINDGGPTGFALAGLLRVAGGKCPCSPLPLVQLGQVGGGLPAVTGELTDETSVASPVGRKVSRKASKKSQGQKRASKKAGQK
jgi:hypothetical protein